MNRNDSKGTVIGLLLAAGASRRFGSDKLRQPLPDGSTVAMRSCRNLRAATDHVVAVIRPGCDELAADLRKEGADVAICHQAEQGMGFSLAFGIRETVDAGAWVIALADMPWIQPQTIERVAESLRQGASLAAPGIQGRRGHPVGFSAIFRDSLLALQGDRGAAGLLKAYSDPLQLIECDDPGIFWDIDEPMDLATPPPGSWHSLRG
jgi:molybdenum cofactor cytidylyltransferase